ncbi:dihydroxy-acid dehydratase [Vulcanimicrobium alpinum]|uniref:Dihydroxy-acid dehydratase n=1 Tax=Vulcanimicrobium alpinum TaxID=3016050 RepID=A0AAN1XZX8_UNVUL|nr:IlvD/Edd family dehydratase [Vulcanimicrobium alpinum]BDE07568.1 dihydroxy-acid dehydratase [Vulcanimicrobium alpinum]
MELRSAQWFGKRDRDGFIHRSWMRAEGFAPDVFDGRPVIGICNSWSELTSCNVHLRRVAEAVKRGVWEAGGFPLEFPTISLGETYMRPTTMMFRNLMSMDVEESIRANPVDGVVLLSGCDKTTPAQLMGAASVDLPAIMVTGGPMLNGKFQGGDIGSGTMVWQFSEDVRAGRMTWAEFFDAEAGQSRSNGHCMTMGTASTMASMAEALGIAPTGNAAIPAVDSRRYALAQLAGRRIVAMVHEDLRMSKILTRQAFENAIRVNAAIGGSTNAVIHLLAIAGRIGVPLELDDFDRLGRDLPLLVDLQPSGRFLMEDFYYAGGVPAVVRELGERLHRDALTVNGTTIGEATAEAPCWNREVIRTFDAPVRERAGIAVLRGNLAPSGAVIKPSAATPSLLTHRGRAVVFETIEDFKARIDDPDLDVDASCVLVLKGAGPRGYPGMPETGNMPLPPKVLATGVTDMVRISDARMSGTAYGTVVLHTSPEAAVGGTLALVRNGDPIELDVPNRRLTLAIDDAELARRRAAWTPAPPEFARGYANLYTQHVLGAERGADFDFLVGGSGSAVAREMH